METKDWIDLAGAVGSVVVALGTGFLAFATFRLAALTKATVEDAENGLRQAEKHHRENLRPFCVIFFKHSSLLTPFGNEFALQPAVTTSAGLRFPGKKHISIRGRLLNKGLGPAKDVVVYLNCGSSIDENGRDFNGGACWLSHPVVVSGIIGAGEAIDIDISISEQNAASTIVGGQPSPTQTLEGIAQDTYDVVLRYQDIFDNPFRTVHAKGFPQNLSIDLAVASGDRELEAKKATRPNRPTPVFLKGEQPWRTMADIHQQG